MKIGLITLWGSKLNYGQQLQAFALIRFLVLQGHSVTLLRYIGERNNVFLNLCSKINLIGKEKENEGKISTEDERHFNDFQNTYLNYSLQEFFSYTQLKKAVSEYDMLITGSDQVWGPYLIPSVFFARPVIDAYCLHFPSVKRKISYAASFGFFRPRRSVARLFLKRISELDAVSIREQAGYDYLKENGINNVDLVPDPTLLLKKKDYMDIAKINHAKNSYCFCYLLTNKSVLNHEDLIQRLKDVYDSGFLKYTVAKKYTDPGDLVPSIEEWLGLIANANFIVTNSYHGVLFSLIMNTDFFYIPLLSRNGIADGRIDSILKFFDIQNRCIDSFDGIYTLGNRLGQLDWKKINEQLNRFATVGSKFLQRNVF